MRKGKSPAEGGRREIVVEYHFHGDSCKDLLSLYFWKIILFSVGLLAVYNNALKLEDVERELEFVQNGGQWKPDCIPRKKVITRLNYLGGKKKEQMSE